MGKMNQLKNVRLSSGLLRHGHGNRGGGGDGIGHLRIGWAVEVFRAGDAKAFVFGAAVGIRDECKLNQQEFISSPDVISNTCERLFISMGHLLKLNPL